MPGWLRLGKKKKKKKAKTSEIHVRPNGFENNTGMAYSEEAIRCMANNLIKKTYVLIVEIKKLKYVTAQMKENAKLFFMRRNIVEDAIDEATKRINMLEKKSSSLDVFNEDPCNPFRGLHNELEIPVYEQGRMAAMILDDGKKFIKHTINKLFDVRFQLIESPLNQQCLKWCQEDISEVEKKIDLYKKALVFFS